MVVKRIVLVYMLLVGTMSLAMEDKKEREKGKEHEPYIATEQLITTLDIPKHPSLVDQLCPPTPSTPLSTRKVRTRSLTTSHPRVPLITQRAVQDLRKMPVAKMLELRKSRRHSLEALTTESRFNLLQENMSLFDVLEMYPPIKTNPIENTTEVRAWIDIVYSLLTESPIQEDLQEKKFSLCKFLVARMEQAAHESNDPDLLKDIGETKEIILSESKQFYADLYMQKAVQFMLLAKRAYPMAQEESDVRRKYILYNAAAAFCKESKDYYANAENMQPDLGEKVNGGWELLSTIVSKITTFDTYASYKQKQKQAISEKENVQKIMSDVEANEKKIVDKEQKSNTPRTRTSKFTMDSKLKKADTKKLKEIIKKLQKQAQKTTILQRKKELEKVKEEFIALKKSKETHEYYKRIMEYKITKLKKQNIQLLTQAENSLFKSAAYYIKAFGYNPCFTLITAIKDIIDRIERVYAKKKLHGSNNINTAKLDRLKNKFRSIKQEVKGIINPLYQEEII